MKTVLRNSGVRLLLTIIFFSGTLQAQEKKSEKALLWMISGNGLPESSYLFGTYHLLGSKFLEDVPEIKQPFAKAKGVVVETIIDSAKLQSVMIKSIMLEKRISSMMSAEEYKLVGDEFLQLTSTNLNQVDMLKPAHVNAVIIITWTQKENRKILQQYSGEPLDLYFAREGKRLGKTVSQFETMDDQFAMLFHHFPEEEQARQLVETIRQKELINKASVEMTNFYISKDLFALYALIQSFPKEVTGDTDYMLKDRNEKWISVLPELMKSGSQFIAVGAGHLPGSDGLIALLRKEGYTVTPVTK